MKKLYSLLLIVFTFPVYAGNDLSFATSCKNPGDKAILSFVGDILIHKPLYLQVLKNKRSFSSLWSETIPLLMKSDFSAGNVEGPTAMGIDENGVDHGDVGFIYDDFIYSGTNLVFNYHPRLLSDLQDSGFDLITAANNHAMDRRSIGVDKTITAAQKIGLKITGVKKSDNLDGDFYSVATIKNLKIAFIGCTEVLNREEALLQALNCESKEIFSLIKTLNQNSTIDAIIVLPHWGVEYSLEVKDYQREYAHRYIEAGAIAVVGSHPHVLEPWEKYVSKDKREGLIFYSLGNFVACQEGPSKQTGVIFYLGLNKAPGQKAHIFAGAYSPVYRKDYSIIPLDESGPKIYQENLEKFYGSKKRIHSKDLLLQKMCL